jgi:hypothetical protein
MLCGLLDQAAVALALRSREVTRGDAPCLWRCPENVSAISNEATVLLIDHWSDNNHGKRPPPATRLTLATSYAAYK